MYGLGQHCCLLPHRVQHVASDWQQLRIHNRVAAQPCSCDVSSMHVHFDTQQACHDLCSSPEVHSTVLALAVGALLVAFLQL
jgi:hypothetical protein